MPSIKLDKNNMLDTIDDVIIAVRKLEQKARARDAQLIKNSRELSNTLLDEKGKLGKKHRSEKQVMEAFTKLTKGYIKSHASLAPEFSKALEDLTRTLATQTSHTIDVPEWPQVQAHCNEMLTKIEDVSADFLVNYINTLNRHNDAPGQKLLKLVDMLIRTAQAASKHSQQAGMFKTQPAALKKAIHTFLSQEIGLDTKQLHTVPNNGLNHFGQLPFKKNDRQRAFRLAYKTHVTRPQTKTITR